MKRLNRKGFTLIELLAVIVILALIMILAIPNVLSAMNSSRVISLHSMSKSIVEWFGNVVVSDSLVATEADKELSPTIVSGITSASTWKCMSEDFAKAAGLSLNDVKIDSSATAVAPGASITSASCSATRYVNGKLEVLLVADPNGKFAISGKTVYAYSEEPNGQAK